MSRQAGFPVVAVVALALTAFAQEARTVRFDHGGGGMVEFSPHASAELAEGVVAEAAFFFSGGARPGASGEAEVRVELLGGAVVPEAGALELRVSPRSTAVRLGRPLVDAPRPASRASAFAGQLVHQDAVVFRVPVEIASDAACGTHEVCFSVDAELFDGERGTPAGLRRVGFVARLDVEVAPAGSPRENLLATRSIEPVRAGSVRAARPEARRAVAPVGAPMRELEPRSAGDLRWMLLVGGLVLAALWVGWRARLTPTPSRG